MRKIIALLLAACMLAGLPVVSFAAEDAALVTVGVSIKGKGPDEIVNLASMSINESGGIRTDFEIVSNKKPKSEFRVSDHGPLSPNGNAGFPKNFFEDWGISKIEERQDGTFVSNGWIRHRQYTESEIGAHIGGITIEFEDGETVDFTAQVDVTAAPVFNLVVEDETGKNVLGNKNEIPLGKGTFKLKVEGLEALKNSDITTLSVRWEVQEGNKRILVNGEVPDTIRDPHTVNVADIDDPLLPFALDFEATTIGHVRLWYGVFDENNEFVYDIYWGLNIEGEQVVIDESTLKDEMKSSDSGYTVQMDVFEGGKYVLNGDSFAAMQEKAGDKPVEIVDESGVSITFTPEALAAFKNGLDKPFNPSVNPDASSRTGVSGGKWVRFMHDGLLPAGIVIRVPVESRDINTVWYYDETTGKAVDEGIEVTYEEKDGKLYAVFTITHCSYYALYPKGINPNPVKNTNTATPSSTGGGSSSSDKSSTAASVSWSDVRTRIRDAKNGETVFVTLTKGERLSASVVRALAKAEGVTLRVRYEGETLYISSEDAAGMEVKDYSWKELLRLFGAEKEDPSSEADDTEVSGTKPNPGTGAYPVR